MKTCPVCGRRRLGRSRFCHEHRPKTHRPRKSTNDRDYGARHKAVRAEYARAMEGGFVFLCPRCDLAVDPQLPWDLDHTDDRTGYLGPAHRTCNRRAAAEKKNRRSA